MTDSLNCRSNVVGELCCCWSCHGKGNESEEQEGWVETIMAIDAAVEYGISLDRSGIVAWCCDSNKLNDRC